MSDESKLRSLFPPICPFRVKDLHHPLTYIAAAGFEDRAMAILDCFIRENISIEKAVAIEYRPHGDPRNRLSEFKDKLEKVCGQIVWTAYDRRHPQKFQETFPSLLMSMESSPHILVDISAISKLLVMLLLQSMRKVQKEVTIAYAEAEIYHPTEREFEEEKRKLGATPDFLTTGIFDILTVTSLSSVSMQGYPILLLVFPTFNHLEIVALYNEISPQLVILLEGDPHEERDKWRLQAIREVNKNFIDNPDYVSKSMTLSTFHYVSTVEALEEIYRNHCHSNKILLAPTGSKFQTIAASMFKQLHPDVQIVYPITGGFRGEYSEQVRALWSISLRKFSDFVTSLNRYSYVDEYDRSRETN